MRQLTYDEWHRFYAEAKKIDPNVISGIVASETLRYWIGQRGLTPEETARTLLARPPQEAA